MKAKITTAANIPAATRRAVYRRDGYRCALCDDVRGLQIHHAMPRSVGGSDDEMNLVTLCWRCPRCGARCGCGGVAVLATHRCARGARHSLARPPRLCALSARLPPLAQMAARSGRKRLRARRGGFAAPPLLPLAPAPASVCAASSGGGGLARPFGRLRRRRSSAPAPR